MFVGDDGDGDTCVGMGLRGKRYFDIFVECCRARYVLGNC